MANRRQFLIGGATLSVGLAASGLATNGWTQAGTDPRLVLVILRGGLDGLAAVVPYADKHYQRARQGLALAGPGKADGVLDVDGFFGLHPSLTKLHGLFARGQALGVHAIAPPYRARSHFDAQDVLEVGLPDPSATDSGWLYRAIQAMQGDTDLGQYAYALGPAVPLVLRGVKPVGAWSADRLPEPDPDTMARLMSLYADDGVLGPKLETALAGQEVVGANMRGSSNNLRTVVTAAAQLLKEPHGPRVAVMDAGGWDTHARQGAAQGQLANRLSGLDEALHELRLKLGPAWSQTVVAVVTEFGRTVAVNGTRGTDHGVAGACFLLGGAVRGGKVLADWPGLAKADLFEGRDLLPTTDMRALFAGLLVDHMQMPSAVVATEVFPSFTQHMTDLVGAIS